MPEPKGGFAALRQLARSGARTEEETCDLCGEPMPAEHRHLLNLSSREVLCACRACAVLFDLPAAGGGTRALIPTRCSYLPEFRISDAQWESLHIPVQMAFFSYSSTAGRVIALYPSPAGATESLLTLETWQELERENPALEHMQPDVEALLVDRVRGARDYFIVPIDECYRLVGTIRLSWRGLSGGTEVWKEIDRFFTGLKVRAGVRGGPHA